MKKYFVIVISLMLVLSSLSSCSLLFKGDEKNNKKEETTPAETTPAVTTAGPQSKENTEPKQPDDEYIVVKIDPINIGENVVFSDNTVVAQWKSIGTVCTALEGIRSEDGAIYFKVQVDGRNPEGTNYAVLGSSMIIDPANKVGYVSWNVITDRLTDEYSDYNKVFKVEWPDMTAKQYPSSLLEMIEAFMGDEYDENAWYIVHNGALYDAYDYEIITDLDKQNQKKHH